MGRDGDNRGWGRGAFSASCVHALPYARSPLVAPAGAPRAFPGPSCRFCSGLSCRLRSVFSDAWRACVQIKKKVPISADIKAALIANIRRRMTPQPVKIRADVELKCFQYDGVLHIKVRPSLQASKSCTFDPLCCCCVSPPAVACVPGRFLSGGGFQLCYAPLVSSLCMRASGGHAEGGGGQ